MGKVMRDTLGASLNIRHNLSSSKGLFFFNDTATTEIYTLSLHDALPISNNNPQRIPTRHHPHKLRKVHRSEEHTSELQSPCNLVCRLLLEKKNRVVKMVIRRPI